MTSKYTVSELLNAAWFLDKSIQANADKIQRLRSQAERLTTHLSDMPRGGGPAHGMDEVVATIADIETTLTGDNHKMQQLLVDVRQLVATVPNYKQRIVLQRRYVNFETFEVIAYKLHFSYRHTTRLHWDGIAWLQQNMARENMPEKPPAETCP